MAFVRVHAFQMLRNAGTVSECRFTYVAFVMSFSGVHKIMQIQSAGGDKGLLATAAFIRTLGGMSALHVL